VAAKVTAPATARHGSALTYTITITDQGPSAAWQLALAGHLPAGTAFRAATAGRGHCTTPHTGARGATVQCHLASNANAMSFSDMREFDRALKVDDFF